VKYMLLINYEEQAWLEMPLPERQRIYSETVRVADDLTSRGQYLTGFPLQPSTSTASVQVREGKQLVTDGPFAETREHLGGFMIIDVKNLDEAAEVAGRIPLARFGTIVIRPVREGPPA